MRFTLPAALAVGVSTLIAGPTPAAASPPAEQLVWRSCPDEDLAKAGAQCAEVTVPLDYSAPGGRTVKIAISRIKATAGPKRGILLGNPGGPGGAGLGYLLSLRPALGAVADQYDLIGFDPRFLGESQPISCGTPPPPGQPGVRTNPRKDFDSAIESARDLAERCHETNAALLPHASTRNAARDMDAIRAALGAGKLSYFGTSYGADLGAVFTQMFPARADRIVIDSSTDPAASQYELFQRTGRPLERAMDEWAAWVAGHHSTYRLGRTATEVRDTVWRVLKHAGHTPIPVDGNRISAHVVRLMLKQSLHNQEHNPALAALVRDLVAADAGTLTKPGPELAAMLGLLTSPELEASLVGGALFMCGDGGWPAGGWPKNPRTYWHNMQRSRAAEPVFGPYVNGMIAPCAFWKSTPREGGTAIGNNVPVLMLHALRDNNVTYDGALALHRRLAGSRMVTADIRSHGVYGRGAEGLTAVPCADEAVNDYLRGGALPTGDITC
ncbi:alpha/beta hydrolase [Kibdelosporangium phytohabitans]|uniref:Hydrolase n=1 Tax=Kibdelosporangium phytohabitans TaxID=860235 RepID=A0A0N9I7S7_9PSEU|nr:alpha/beta hydrolase [Kibdelosporangium phytohabitans]ALG11897.1 hydrolase [Kibdelosporangium phytohabitans]MBE1463344.1 pimeloyl-ACP methyl ester carboxylesterase [Kibdelosporangium phytohabitans]